MSPTAKYKNHALHLTQKAREQEELIERERQKQDAMVQLHENNQRAFAKQQRDRIKSEIKSQIDRNYLSVQHRKELDLSEGKQLVDRDRQLKKMIDKELKLKKKLSQSHYKQELVRQVMQRHQAQETMDDKEFALNKKLLRKISPVVPRNGRAANLEASGMEEIKYSPIM